MMRYQRVSPDCLPLSNGKKPSMRTLCKEDGATENNGKIIQTNGNNTSSSSSLEAKAFRFRSPARNQDHHHSLTQFGGGVSDNNNQLHHSHHENNSNTHQSQRQESSPSPTPSPSHGSGDVLLQWGHKKRSRVSRTEIRALTDESSSSAQARQGVKLQRRVVHSSSSSEKLSANSTMPPPPPPPPLPSISSSSNGRARKETSGLLPSRNLEDRSGAGNGSPLRNNGGGSGSRIVSRSASAAAGKRSPPSPADNKNEKKVLGCSGKSGKEDKANGSSVQGGDRVNHVDSSSLQSEQEAAAGATNTTTTTITTNIAPSAAAVGGDKVNSFEVIEWPRIYIALSRKEKEDDFLAMKGTKLPQRPKKRAKNIDRALQYCFPGMWLSDLTRNRYEVREKKCVKKQKRRGLKGMESLESDSE